MSSIQSLNKKVVSEEPELDLSTLPALPDNKESPFTRQHSIIAHECNNGKTRETCITCHGQGTTTIQCSKCDENESKTEYNYIYDECTTCIGRGILYNQLICLSCNGIGCHQCQYYGKINQMIICSQCKGNKYILAEIEITKISCSECKGYKYSSEYCKDCNGNKFIEKDCNYCINNKLNEINFDSLSFASFDSDVTEYYSD